MSQDDAIDSGSRIERRGKLRDGESLFLSLVHSIPAYFVRKDRNGVIVFANDQYASLMGTTSAAMVGKTMADVIRQNNSDDLVFDRRWIGNRTIRSCDRQNKNLGRFP